LKSYIEGAGDAIYVLRTDNGRIINCNSRACLDLGYSKNELIKLSATDIETSISSGEIDVFHFDLKPGEVKTFEGMHKRKDGSVFPVEIRLSSLSPTQTELMISIVRDITERKKTEDALKETLDQLKYRVREGTITLEETNTALRVLIKKGGIDQKNLEKSLQSIINQLVKPFLYKLRVKQSNSDFLTYLNILEENLKSITSPFIHELSAVYRNLTPKEIQIAELVKQGMRSKEIAELLGVSVGTVVTHRNNIRKKLELKSRDANLRSHLLSLAQ
jgi:PAS domain S-box-containing protein